MKNETFEAICPTCGKKNEVTVKLREDGFNEWEEIHCAWCGLFIDQVHSATTPQTRIIGGVSEESE
jgi:uncharacterized Zn finger protein